MSAAPKSTGGKKIGIGLIGTGAVGHYHASGVGASDSGTIVSVFNRTRAKAVAFAADFGIDHVSDSLEELLARPDIDAVIIATPTGAHADAAIAAMDAGKHVLVEKPMALNSAEAARMVEASERNGVHLALASGRSRLGEVEEAAHAMIERGELGDVYHVLHTEWRLRGRPGHHMLQDCHWFLNHEIAGGGALIDIGVYAIDGALWWLGMPKVESVMAQIRQSTEEPSPEGVPQDVEDHAFVFIRCEGGKTAYIDIAWVSNMRNPDSIVSIFGTKAGLRLDPLTKISARPTGPDDFNPSQEWAPSTLVEERILPYGSSNFQPGWGAVTTEFVNSLAAGTEPVTPARHALEVTRVMEAAYRSAAEGVSVALPEVNLPPRPTTVV